MSKQNFPLKTVIALSVLLACCGCEREAEKNAALMTGGNPQRGRRTIAQYGCSSCHSIPGVPGADGLVGPPLQRIAARTYIGGVLINTPENMIRWLENPPAVDPLTAMPNVHLSDPEARDVASYLFTLK
jgi:cytochrome c